MQLRNYNQIWGHTAFTFGSVSGPSAVAVHAVVVDCHRFVAPHAYLFRVAAPTENNSTSSLPSLLKIVPVVDWFDQKA
jgi:hypothetical protein